MFKDRYDAAYQLVPHLMQYRDNPDALIIAIPRGSLEIGSVLAHELHLPLDVIFTKKIGYPGNEEFAIGAVSLHHIMLSPNFTHLSELRPYIEEQTAIIRKLLHERALHYRGNKPPLQLQDKIVIVVDDGVATGNTLMATLSLIKADKPHKIIVALPVAPPSAYQRIRAMVDEIVCLEVPEHFMSVGQFYERFDQVDDEEAIRLLREAQ